MVFRLRRNETFHRHFFFLKNEKQRHKKIYRKKIIKIDTIFAEQRTQGILRLSMLLLKN